MPARKDASAVRVRWWRRQRLGFPRALQPLFIDSLSRLNATSATTSKTFRSTMTAAAITRYIHQSTYGTSTRLAGFPLRHPTSNPLDCPLRRCEIFHSSKRTSAGDPPRQR